MQDHNLSLHHATAVAFWAAAAALVVAGMVTGVIGLGHLGLLCGAGAAVLHARGFACRITREIAETERNAFELGKDYAEVRPMTRR